MPRERGRQVLEAQGSSTKLFSYPHCFSVPYFQIDWIHSGRINSGLLETQVGAGTQRPISLRAVSVSLSDTLSGLCVKVK